MSDSPATTLVRWRLRRTERGRGASPLTLWHFDSPTLSNTVGRTGCGRRYPRAHAALLTVPAGTVPADQIDVAAGECLCRNCLRAYASEGA